MWLWVSLVHWRSVMPEDEPIFPLIINGEDHELHRWNTSLFNYAGELACYDHVFVVTEDTDETQSGWYIFQTAEAYEELGVFIVENDFPAHTGLLEICDMDVEAWESHFLTEEACFPEDWVA